MKAEEFAMFFDKSDLPFRYDLGFDGAELAH